MDKSSDPKYEKQICNLALPSKLTTSWLEKIQAPGQDPGDVGLELLVITLSKFLPCIRLTFHFMQDINSGTPPTFLRSRPESQTKKKKKPVQCTSDASTPFAYIHDHAVSPSVAKVSP